jgi:predicted nucleic acid-binding protein
MTYADTSFISSCYLPDAHSQKARAYLEKQEPRLPFVFLHWPELAKAVTAASPDARGDWEAIRQDVQAGQKLYAAMLDAERTGRRAAGLMRNFYPRWKKLRSLDALHVAAAVELGCRTFLSFDSGSCQRVLAAAQKLAVWPPLAQEEQLRFRGP